MLSKGRIKIAPSILSADFSRFGEQVAEASKGGADMVHVDVMDGHFVPDITFGPKMVKAIRRWTDLPLDVHMMVSRPQDFIKDLADGGANIVTVHAEVGGHLHRTLQQIKSAGLKAGLALSPATPVAALEYLLPDLDMVVVMTVNPGYGGQSFIESQVSKIARIRALIDQRRLPTELEVDGGINPTTIRTAVAAGATVLVAGNAVYAGEGGVAESITRLRKAATTAGAKTV
ncbi:MAG: ribulose-phosphate 3-epimerase [SAR202 cluster bacterium]|nr:ribulose-phosphate 3-epimerase [SAR202 cluster bacterium]